MSDINFEPDDDFKVLVEGEDEIPKEEEEEVPEEFKDLDKKALMEKLEAERAALEETKKQVNEVAALKEGLASLGENLKKPNVSIQPQQVQSVRKSEDEYREEFNEKFVEDPYSAMVKFQAEKLAPEIQRLMMSNLQISRKFLQFDPDRKETYAKYHDEIEQEVSKVAPRERLEDTEVYQKAHDRVMARHINDIVQLKVQEVLKQQEEEAKKKTSSTSSPTYVEHTMNTPPTKKEKYIVLTQEEKNRANLLGIPLTEYARYLKERGKK